jgi:hypothetical protein
MVRRRSDVSNGRHLVWLSPEWLVRFRADVPLTNEYGEPTKALTVADCAAIIAVLGRFTNDIVNPLDSGDSDLAVEIREKKSPREMPSFSVPWPELRSELGLVGRRDVERIYERLRYALVDGESMFDLDGGFFGTATVKPTFQMRYAHPLNSGVRQAVPVDVNAWSRFSCVHSVPIAARLMVWLSTRCRVGQNRTTKYGTSYLEHTIKASRVCRDMGLTMKKFHPSFVPLDRIKLDLATIGIQTEWVWTYEGRTPIELRVKAWRTAFCLSAQAATPNVTRNKEWQRKKADYAAENHGG